MSDASEKARAADGVQIEKYNDADHWIAHVEFDDFGTLADFRQLDELEKEVLHADNAKLFKNGITLVAFIHGWQNNSSVDNANLKSFREMVAELSRTERGRGRGVLGVYLSWRGEFSPLPGVKHLSYWGRKATAHTIGDGNLPEALVRLKNLNYALADRSPKGFAPYYAQTRLVLVGHSFGAAALYSAVSGPLKTDFIENYTHARLARGSSLRPMAPVTGFGDLVLLINPAFEALRYRNIDYHIRYTQNVSYSPNQPVLMLIAASEGDTATTNLLPIGQWLGNTGRVFTSRLGASRGGPSNETQRRQLLSAVGNWSHFYTHYLTPGPDGRGTLLHTAEFEAEAKRKPEPKRRISQYLVAPNPTPSGQPLTPFIMMRVDPKLIRNHSEIWGSDFAKFIVDFTAEQNKFISQKHLKEDEAKALQLIKSKQ